MRTGKISYNILQRSVRKPMKSGNNLFPGFLQYKGIAQTGTRKGDMVMSVCSETIDCMFKLQMLFARSVNRITCEHAVCEMAAASVLLPEDTEETFLQEITETMTKLCKKKNISFALEEVSVSKAVCLPVVTVSCHGRLHQDGVYQASESNAAIVAIGHAGASGAALLAKEKVEELSKHYAGAFLDGARAFDKSLCIPNAQEEPQLWRHMEKSYCFPVEEGGVLAALWYLADGLSGGFELSMKAIPICQETVEICEFYRINPYQLAGDGMMLVVTSNPRELQETWKAAGYETALLGFLQKEKARVIKNEDEVRYLDKPAQDELEKICDLIKEKV